MHTVLYLTFIRGKHHKLAFTLKPVIIRRDRSDPRLKRHTGHSRREGVWCSLFLLTDAVDEGPSCTLAGGQASVRRWRPPGCVEGTTWPPFIDIPCVALPSAALSRSVCPSEGAETGSWMTPASMPDVTAQLGRLMTEAPGPAHTCPS